MYDWEASWYEEGREYQKEVGIDDLDNRPQLRTDDPNLHLDSGVANFIYDFDNSAEVGKGVISPQTDMYLPTWQVCALLATEPRKTAQDTHILTLSLFLLIQTSPVTQRSVVNENFAGKSEAALSCLKYHEVTFDRMQYSRPGYGSDDDRKSNALALAVFSSTSTDNNFAFDAANTAEIAWLLRMATGDRNVRYEGDIYSNVYFPVYSSFDASTRESVAVMRAVM